MLGLLRSAAILMVLSCEAVGQIRVLTDAEMPTKVDRIVTNGELTPGAHFHLLLIYSGSDASTVAVNQMLRAPGREMQPWVAACNVRVMDANEPQASEHHLDLLQKHAGQFPILALVEHTQGGKGAVWCSAAGRDVPTTESSLASWLGRYYNANLQAAQQAGVSPRVNDGLVNSLTDTQRKLQNERSGGSYFMPRNQAPEPVRLPGRRPLLNPQVDVAMPDALQTSVGLQDGAMMGIGAAVVAILCSMILAYGRTQAAQIHANAITEDPADDDNGE